MAGIQMKEEEEEEEVEGKEEENTNEYTKPNGYTDAARSQQPHAFHHQLSPILQI